MCEAEVPQEVVEAITKLIGSKPIPEPEAIKQWWSMPSSSFKQRSPHEAWKESPQEVLDLIITMTRN